MGSMQVKAKRSEVPSEVEAQAPTAKPEDEPRQESHGVTRDHADYAKAKPAASDYLRYAHKRSGRSPLELTREFVRLRTINAQHVKRMRGLLNRLDQRIPRCI